MKLREPRYMTSMYWGERNRDISNIYTNRVGEDGSAAYAQVSKDPICIRWPPIGNWFKNVVVNCPEVVDVASLLANPVLGKYRFSDDEAQRLAQGVTALSSVDLTEVGYWRDTVRGYCADQYESTYLIWKEA